MGDSWLNLLHTVEMVVEIGKRLLNMYTLSRHPTPNWLIYKYKNKKINRILMKKVNDLLIKHDARRLISSGERESGPLS